MYMCGNQALLLKSQPKSGFHKPVNYELARTKVDELISFIAFEDVFIKVRSCH